MHLRRACALCRRRRANRSWHRRSCSCAVCDWRSGICSRANGAARCNAVALVLMQAGRVSPARTQTSAESTRGPIVAAVSTEIDGKGCICVERPASTHLLRHSPCQSLRRAGSDVDPLAAAVSSCAAATSTSAGARVQGNERRPTRRCVGRAGSDVDPLAAAVSSRAVAASHLRRRQW